MSSFEKRTPARPRDAKAIARLNRDAYLDERTGCIIWTGARCHGGYGNVTYNGRTWLAHRLAYSAWRGAIPKGLYVCHRCDNRVCVAIEHLFLGTPQNNTNDMLRKNRARWRSKLREIQVVDIKRRLVLGERVSDLAAKHGVHYATVLAIKSGRNWSHVAATETAPEGRGRCSSNRIPILEFRVTE